MKILLRTKNCNEMKDKWLDKIYNYIKNNYNKEEEVKSEIDLKSSEHLNKLIK